MGEITRYQEVRNTLVRLEPEIQAVLPEGVSARRFVRIAQTAVQNNPQLQNADRNSLLGAFMKCAERGLVPDGIQATITVFKGKAQYMPMVAGLTQKILEHKSVSSFFPSIVYEKDIFEHWTDENGEHFKHVPHHGTDRGGVVYAYAVARMTNGTLYVEVMNIDDINQVRGCSSAANGPAWKNWFAEMARKAVAKRLAKRLPLTDEVRAVIDDDNEQYDPAVDTHIRTEPAKPNRLAAAIVVEEPEQPQDEEEGEEEWIEEEI